MRGDVRTKWMALSNAAAFKVSVSWVRGCIAGIRCPSENVRRTGVIEHSDGDFLRLSWA